MIGSACPHLYSHKGFFSSSYNLEKKFGMLFNGHGLTQLANGHTYVMTEKTYTTATWSMETETWRHCILTHQMKLQQNLHVQSIMQGGKYVACKYSMVHSNFSKQTCIYILGKERKYIIIVMAFPRGCTTVIWHSMYCYS